MSTSARVFAAVRVLPVWAVPVIVTLPVGLSFTAAVTTATCTDGVDSEAPLSFATTVKAFKAPLALAAGVQ